MDAMRSLSSYFAVLVRLFAVLLFLRVRGVYRRLFPERGHRREHREFEASQQILYQDSTGGIAIYVVRFLGGDSVQDGVYKQGQSPQLIDVPKHQHHTQHYALQEYNY